MKAKFLKLLSIMAVLSLLAMSNNLFAQWAKNAVSGIKGMYGYGVTVDAAGNSYLVGRYDETTDFDPSAGTATLGSVSNSYDIYLAKYDSDGNYLWANGIGSTATDYGYAVALDGSGGVYITGYINSGGSVDFDPGAGEVLLTSNGEYDVFFAKYNVGDGSLVWAKNIGGAEKEYSYGIEVVGGGVYIAGRYEKSNVDMDPDAGSVLFSSNGLYDIFFAKYSATDGSYIWAKSIGGGSTDYAYDLAVDASGNLYITGILQGTIDFDPDGGTQNLTSAGERDVFFAKYASADGAYIWAKNVGTAGSSDANDYGYGIAVDASANVYITGRFEGTGDYDPGAGVANITSLGTYDTFIAKYNSSGDYQWAQAVGGTEAVYGQTLVTDGTNVYVSGTYKGTSNFGTGGSTINLTSAGNKDVWFGKYSAATGASVWAKSVGGTDIDDQAQYGNPLALGSLHLTGYFYGTADFDPDAGTNNLTSAGSCDAFNTKYLEAGGGLPVELTSFTATNNGDGVVLNWTTATEVNNYGFEVEASSNNGWEMIAFVEGHGNSNSPKEYTYFDAEVAERSRSYRLKQIDNDGSFEYSNVVEVNGNLPKEVVLNQNHPNPFNPSTVISYSIPKTSNVSIIVYNALGQEVANLINKSQNAGTYSVEFDASELTSGIYIYTLQSAGVLQSKKMLLIK